MNTPAQTHTEKYLLAELANFRLREQIAKEAHDAAEARAKSAEARYMVLRDVLTDAGDVGTLIDKRHAQELATLRQQLAERESRFAEIHRFAQSMTLLEGTEAEEGGILAMLAEASSRSTARMEESDALRTRVAVLEKSERLAHYEREDALQSLEAVKSQRDALITAGDAMRKWHENEQWAAPVIAAWDAAVKCAQIPANPTVAQLESACEQMEYALALKPQASSGATSLWEAYKAARKAGA